MLSGQLWPTRVLVLMAALLPSGAWAQTPAQSFDELRQLVNQDEVIVVTDDTGNRTKGRLAALSDSSLTLLVGRKRESRVFAVHRTARIERPDRLSEGLLIGMGGGALFGWGWVRSECGPPGYDDECSTITTLVFVPISVGIGAGVGALVDAMIHKTLYQSRQQPVRLTVAPVVTRDRRSVVVSIGWR